MASRFQFSLHFLLAATVAVAASAMAARAKLPLQADSLTAFFLTGVVVGLLNTVGKLRAFWIGVAVVLGTGTIASTLSVLLAYAENAMNDRGPGLRPRTLAAVWCAAPLNGLLAVFLHWLFAPSRKPPA